MILHFSILLCDCTINRDGMIIVYYTKDLLGNFVYTKSTTVYKKRIHKTEKIITTNSFNLF